MNPIKVDILDLIKRMKKSEQEFMPIWSNLEYWFPEEFIPTLSRAWGFAHSLEDETKYLLMIPLLKVTKFFSYGDENVHKLYKSKFSRKKIKELLEGDWKSLFYSMLEKEIMTLLRKQWEYFKLKPQNVKYDIKFGIDTLETKLDNDVNILITSPPYLQAQEYIRSTKIELFWLGYDESYIRSLSKKEIPYRDVKKIEIYSNKYYECKDKISEDHLRILFDRYFYATLSIYSNLSENIKDYMFIFVSPAKIRANPIPIDDIIVEHLSHLGWKHQITYIDKIVSRVMFESKVNPASGIEDSRMKTEHLIIMKR